MVLNGCVQCISRSKMKISLHPLTKGPEFLLWAKIPHNGNIGNDAKRCLSNCGNTADKINSNQKIILQAVVLNRGKDKKRGT